MRSVLVLPFVLGAHNVAPAPGLGAPPAWFPTSVGQVVQANTNDIYTDGITSAAAAGFAVGNEPWAGGGVRGVWMNWNGGVYCPTLGAAGVMLYFGGAHGGYLGNEVYALFIAEGIFARLCMPTWPWTEPLDYVHGELATGWPMAFHTYGMPQWWPKPGTPHGQLVIPHHASDHDQAGDGATIAHHFDIGPATWQRGGAFEYTPPNAFYEGFAAYDSRRQLIYHAMSSHTSPLWAYDPAAMTHTQVASCTLTVDTMAAYCPQIDAVIFSDRRLTSDSLWAFDCANPSDGVFQLNETGPTPPDGSHGFEWCPPRNKLYACTHESAVYWTLTPPWWSNWKTGTWTWEAFSLSQTIPEGRAGGQEGPYTQFRWLSRFPNEAYFVTSNKWPNAYVAKLG